MVERGFRSQLAANPVETWADLKDSMVQEKTIGAFQYPE